jgi:hypothetical protein
MDRVEPPVSELRERGRDHYRRRQWIAAFAALSQADEIEPLTATDLWLLAWSAHLTGRDEDFARTMGRAYRSHLDAGESLPAARCAGWLGAMLAVAGEIRTCGRLAEPSRTNHQTRRDRLPRTRLPTHSSRV